MNRDMEYVGNMSQLFEIKNYRFEGGKADGVRGTDIKNRNGLEFTVIADRCMDITSVRYKGINISYLNPCGIVAPAYYDKDDTQWLRNFTAGFMTTCGFDNIGSPCNENGINYGLHGRLSNIPAEEFCVCMNEKDGKRYALITGEMKQNVLFGENLKLKRCIKAFQDQDKIEITDEIRNAGFRDEEYMILYHCNIGYPFLSPECEVRIDSAGSIPRNEYSEKYYAERYKVTEPNDLDEMCYYHNMNNYNGVSVAGIYQPEFNLGMTITYENHILDHFVQWKNMSRGQYVMGLEPGSNWVEGKKIERTHDTIKILKPLEHVSYKIVFQFHNNIEKFDQAFMKGYNIKEG